MNGSACSPQTVLASQRNATLSGLRACSAYLVTIAPNSEAGPGPSRNITIYTRVLGLPILVGLSSSANSDACFLWEIGINGSWYWNFCPNIPHTVICILFGRSRSCLYKKSEDTNEHFNRGEWVDKPGDRKLRNQLRRLHLRAPITPVSSPIQSI